MQFEPANEIHAISEPGVRWSRVNVSESFPNVAKPLSWAFFGEGANLSWRPIFENFGLIAPGEPLPGSRDTGYIRLFFGRCAINMDAMSTDVKLMPGDHSADHARDLFSEDFDASPQLEGERFYDREKFLAYCHGVADIVVREFDEIMVFWRELVGPQGLVEGKDPVATYRDAFARYVRVQTNHSANSSLSQQHFSRATALAQDAGLPELASSLTTGIGDTFDTRAMAGLWAVSRGQRTLEDYLAELGFQETSGDDISTASWRESPGAIRALVENYRKMDESASPLASEHMRVAQRREAEARIIAALPEGRREEARAHFADLSRAMRVRELGKASYRVAIDVGRAAARARGRDLQRLGCIDAADDVFFLTVDECIDGPPRDFRDVVDERKAIHARYAQLDIPGSWTGNPEPIASETRMGSVEIVRGIGVSAGIAEGPVRVVIDHIAAEEMEPGEILVTSTTDPSWGPFFVMAGALVIDIGGPMSHGAIIARELGIPCAINTRDGTRQLRDGMIVRVDGGTGEVRVLAEADTR